MRGYWVILSILLFHTPVAQRVEAAVSKTVNVRVQILPGVPRVNSEFWTTKICAAVAQLEEVPVLETGGCGFKSHQQYQVPGCSSAWLRVAALEAEGRRFKSYHPDHLPVLPCLGESKALT